MKKLLLLSFSFLSFAVANCQQKYWQQKTDYKIDVTLNDVYNSITGVEQINYYNNSTDTLQFIWFHVWPNAYKNDRTAFSDQLLENGRTDFYFSPENKKGYINQLNFKTDNVNAVTEDHPQHQDIIKLILAKPLPPGGMVKIETPFHVKLPYNFSRGGHVNQSYQLTQWYPKPAVYDKNGWHEMPYLDQGEFYSEFGNYEVSITLPENYVVAATGQLQNADAINNNPSINKITDTENNATPASAANTKTLRYLQDDVHDFAWFADKTFIVKKDSLSLPSGKIISVFAYVLSKNIELWSNSINYIKSAVTSKSNWLGSYPYNTVSVVDNASPNGGGMEYPTITLLSADGSEKSLESVINHEVGHNWFYGILASNERRYPWMDEGMNAYYDKRFDEEASAFKNEAVTQNSFIKKRVPKYPEELLLATIVKLKKDQPISTASEKFSALNYGLVAYVKASLWLKKMETLTGRETFDKIMKAYYEKWKFKHPSPADFKEVAEEVSNQSMNELFNELDVKGPLVKPVKKQIKLTSFFNLNATDKQHYISVAPVAGFNYYDKLMIGAVVHNYNLPLSNFQFFVAPLYATGTKKINGIGRLAYNYVTNNKGAKLIVAVAGAQFTGGTFTDSLNTKNALPFYKIAPSIKYVFGNKNARSAISKYIQFKSFIINETEVSFKRDLVNNIDIITYPKQQRYVNQLQAVIENNRVLYPYNAALQAEQRDGFVRLNFTGNYYFNYADKGGLNVRLFAGKFIYTGDKSFTNQFKTDRYHLNMSGPKGYEDYNYSNYFIGRNEFEGFASQQIMNRDGFFKVRTDLLSSKIGKTDDWLTAVNLTSSIPNSVNPLSVLPIKLPLKLFADIGTYAEAWDKNNTSGRFLYDAGVQLSLFKNVVNVYFPLIYSKAYGDYFKSTITEKRFVKNISFSIDIQQLSFSKLLKMPSL